MIIFPAIDIKNGKVVRLKQGKFDDITEYSDDPLAMAMYWKDKGARWLHIVDLDGAETQVMKNKEIIKTIAQKTGIPIQVGGGIRQKKDIVELIEAGVQRVVIGTKAVEDRKFLEEILTICPDNIAVSLDCHKGFVALQGWQKTSDKLVTDFVQELQELGVRYIVYTDIARDGMLTGPNFEALTALLDIVYVSIIASGGVSSVKDIELLKTLEPKGLLGVITGKALYEKTLELEQAIKVAL